MDENAIKLKRANREKVRNHDRVCSYLDKTENAMMQLSNSAVYNGMKNEDLQSHILNMTVLIDSLELIADEFLNYGRSE